MHPVIAIATVALAAIWSTADAQVRGPAGMPCGIRASVVERLVGEYSESQQAVGLAAGNRAVVELFVSVDGRSWTMLVSFPNGNSCLLANGTDWQGRGQVARGQTSHGS